MQKGEHPTRIENLTGYTLVFKDEDETHIIEPSELPIPVVNKNYVLDQVIQIEQLSIDVNKVEKQVRNLPEPEKNTIYLCLPETAKQLQRPDIYGVGMEIVDAKYTGNGDKVYQDNSVHMEHLPPNIAVATTLYTYPHDAHNHPVMLLRPTPATYV